MRRTPEATSLERTVPRDPLEIQDQLVPHENGCLLDPNFPGLAYCPRCWLSMHESYYPKHDQKECELVQLEEVGGVMKS
jgi:hypothetical protein